jgi:hypothetical protein
MRHFLPVMPLLLLFIGVNFMLLVEFIQGKRRPAPVAENPPATG